MHPISPQKDPGLFELSVLSNGINVFHRHSKQSFGAPKIACSAVVMVGGRDDVPGKEGAAHFFEHMPFRGTKNFPSLRDLSYVIEHNGGYINAFTTDEATGFEIIVPTELMRDSLQRVADILTQPLMQEKDIETERHIIIEELQNKLANVHFYARQELYKGLLGDHPLVHAVIGTEKALLGLSKEDLTRFHKRYYNASNVSLFFAGTYETELLLHDIEKYFGSIRIGELTKRDVFAYPTTLEENTRTVSPKQYNRSVYLLGRIMPAASLKESLMNKLFRDMLSSGMSSPLHEEIREKRGLAYNLGLHHNRYHDLGLLLFMVSTRFKHMDTVQSIFWHEVNAILTKQARFEEVKHMLIQNLMHREYNVGSLVDDAIDSFLDYSRIIALKELISVLENISLEETAAYMHDFLTPTEFLNIRVNCESRTT